MKGGERARAAGDWLSADDLHWFNEGTHLDLHEKLGARRRVVGGQSGFQFSVWAPAALGLSVVGDWNEWDAEADALAPLGRSGIWHAFVPELAVGQRYKFRLRPFGGGPPIDKADPFALYAEVAPQTASILWALDYDWHDGDWMRERGRRQADTAPISIYEVHLGSWRRAKEGRIPSYREIAVPLAEHARAMGFTHVELLPVMEHPFYGSWGYQITGFFAPTSRYGTPQDFMYLIDVLHQHGLGVILDWVPSHFVSDAHGLGRFDGTALYEHADSRQGFHPDWNTYIFNYGRHEVQSFLLSSAFHWLDRYHIDGLRVDAVASMLYLDYSRKEGEWIPNRYGGRENLEAIEFLRRLNDAIDERHPDVRTYAEESTAWPGVSRPRSQGGLGFGTKWDMGWMHDTLRHFARDPIHRRYHHRELSFRLVYAFHERFVLPLSHDEVVHGKGSLIGRMPGDAWRRLANLRLLYGYMFGQPGKKLLFMGAELGQEREWNHDTELDWGLLERADHEGLRRWLVDLNRLHAEEPALHERDFDPGGFEWVGFEDDEYGTLSFLRWPAEGGPPVLVACNFVPAVLRNVRIGVPWEGDWEEVLNGDAREYGGSGQGNLGRIEATPVPAYRRPASLVVTLPPLAAVFFRPCRPRA
ncbi:MAG: 1,4-alpha-glucan branching protein GlgB [Myxococcota bacterium]